jgi:cytochrome c2
MATANHARAAELAEQILAECHTIVAGYLNRSGPTASETISRLLGVIDGPTYRRFEALQKAIETD